MTAVGFIVLFLGAVVWWCSHLDVTERKTARRRERQEDVQ